MSPASVADMLGSQRHRSGSVEYPGAGSRSYLDGVPDVCVHSLCWLHFGPNTIEHVAHQDSTELLDVISYGSVGHRVRLDSCQQGLHRSLAHPLLPRRL